MSPKLLLIDGHGLAYRAFYATAHGRDIMATSKGEWTNAVYVFVNKLLKAWEEEKPDYMIVAFDVGKSFRHEEYEDYKANRSRMPDELRHQLERIDQVISAFDIPSLGCEGWEADDVIGALSKQASAKGIDTVIMTGDTDILQLVDEKTQVLIPRGRYGDDTLYGPDELAERYSGLQPRQLIDLKALTGDASDNIPGIKGIGDKTATALLKEYGTIEGIYEHEDEIKGKRPRDALAGRKEEALLYKDLVTIRRDVPCEFSLEEAKLGDFDREQVIELFRELEFFSLLDRVPGTDGSESEGVATASDALDSEPGPSYVVVDTMDKLTRLTTALVHARALAFDTETTSTDPMTAELVGISLAVAPDRAWYIPVGHGQHTRRAETERATALRELPLFADQESVPPPPPDTSLVSEQGEPQLPLKAVIEHLSPFLEDPALPKYAHNASFDVNVLAQTAGIQVRGLAFDTMIAGWVIEPDSRSLGLKAMAFDRLGIEMTPISDLIGSGKSQITMDRVSVAETAPYACADADVTWRLVKPLKEELEERQQWALFTEIEMPLVPILAQMERVGVRLDVGYLRDMSSGLESEEQAIQERIYELVGHGFNVNSTKQLSEVLYDELDLPKRGIRKTVHGYSTAVDALALLEGKHPIVDLILEYRQVTKLRSTYVDALPALVNPRTERIHTSYNQTGTVTGRLSSSNPNLQNIPIRTETGKQIRRGFVAEEGWLFVAADYSQVELRILAHVSQDPELLDAFARGQDIHARTAAAVYGIPIDQVTSQQRRIAKTVNFGLIYGQSAYGLAQQTELDLDEAERFIATYFTRYPGVERWLDKTRKQAYAAGYVETLLRRRRYFPALTSTQRVYAGERAAAERQAVNAPIQGTAADILKIAMIRLDQGLRTSRFSARMVLQVHDEIVLEVPQDELGPVSRLTRDVMENAYSLTVPLKVDMEVGENWLEMSPV